MKVGILTFHKAKNYGAVLQAYALKTTLKKLKVNPYIINRYAGSKSIIHKLYFTLWPKYILQRITWFSFDRFAKQHLIPKTRKYSSVKSLNKFNKYENFDVVIVGSDQVWRMEFSAIGYNYFLDFIKSNTIKKISYAASFGNDEWKKDLSITTNIKQMLNDFSSISVREISGVKICSDVFNTKATHVLDPTLLLNEKEYDSLLLKNPFSNNENVLVSYILGNQESVKYCNLFAKKNNLDYTDLYYVYQFNSVFSPLEYGRKHYLHLTVNEWITQIKYAKYLVVNSYHATIFAIIFKKQFIVVDHPSGGTGRITSLLEQLGLQDRFISHISGISLNLFMKQINWDLVDMKLAIEKEKSIVYLKESLTK
ncbi:MAG: polysaccharide pyruvyl transferase family protein [Lutibacter sp.]|nr:polysaccharide pyruvyl transferase family protein [Lutibacter sp.]